MVSNPGGAYPAEDILENSRRVLTAFIFKGVSKCSRKKLKNIRTASSISGVIV